METKTAELTITVDVAPVESAAVWERAGQTISDAETTAIEKDVEFYETILRRIADTTPKGRRKAFGQVSVRFRW